MKVRIVEISDIHYGHTDEARLYSETETEVYPFLEEFKPHLIVVGGDLFDRRVPMNHPAAVFANKFIDKLQQYGETVILIHGTLSHDCFQTDSYSHLVSENFRIHKVAAVEYLYGMKLLILPEEYIADKESYYSPFFQDGEKYDYAFGHGMFQHVGASGHEAEKKNTVNWTAKEFDPYIHARVVFGHIHTHSIYKKVVYGGSLTRMAHGEEEAKGFMAYEYDTDTKKILLEKFVENKRAPIYKTIQISSLPQSSTEAITVLKDLYAQCDFLRIYLDIDPPKEILHLAIGFARVTPNVKIDNIRLKKQVASKVVETEEQKKESDFVRKVKALNFRDATKMWAKEMMGVEVSDDMIDDAMSPV